MMNPFSVLSYLTLNIFGKNVPIDKYYANHFENVFVPIWFTRKT